MGEQNVEEVKFILVSIARLEENTKNIGTQLESVLKLVSETPAMNESIKMSHKRIDEAEALIAKTIATTEKLIETKDAAQDERITKLENSQTWLGRSVAAGVLAFILDKIFL